MGLPIAATRGAPASINIQLLCVLDASYSITTIWIWYHKIKENPRGKKENENLKQYLLPILSGFVT